MTSDDLSIVVVGASGDLARKKIFPALFSLYSQGFLPPRFAVFGFARTAMNDDEFRARIMEHLTCRYVPAESCQEKIREFLSRCRYRQGQYDSAKAFLDLYNVMCEAGDAACANRMFFLAVPPSIVAATAQSIREADFAHCGLRQTRGSPRGDESEAGLPCVATSTPKGSLGEAWCRVVIEKPFGSDRQSSDRLTSELNRAFIEKQIYRIDHYLGKEVVQNLMVLRFANAVFEPVWNREHIEKVCIDWREDIGVEERGGYFDSYGIVRDVMQNHLLQILSLLAMDRPASSSADHIRDAKVKVLQQIAPPRLADVVLGQYQAGSQRGVRHAGYRGEKNVAPDSRIPTFASAALRVNNKRWAGVPFALSAGKGLDRRASEVTIFFRSVPGNIFCEQSVCPPPNRLVIRIQPDEAILLNITSKVPGFDLQLDQTDLNLRYAAAFKQTVPEAYECLLLDVIRGEKTLFIRSDELDAAWDIFTPLLREIEEKKAEPLPYDFGSAGPVSSTSR